MTKAAGTLLACGLPAEEGSPGADEDERPADAWGPWSPESSFLHHATRGVPFETATPELRQRLTTRDGRRPALFTEYPDADRIPLLRTLAPRLSVPLEQTLYRSRTHRSFTDQPVSPHDLAVLLRTVFGPAEFIDGFEYGGAHPSTTPPPKATSASTAQPTAPRTPSLSDPDPRHPGRHHRPIVGDSPVALPQEDRGTEDGSRRRQPRAQLPPSTR